VRSERANSFANQAHFEDVASRLNRKRDLQVKGIPLAGKHFIVKARQAIHRII